MTQHYFHFMDMAIAWRVSMQARVHTPLPSDVQGLSFQGTLIQRMSNIVC